MVLARDIERPQKKKTKKLKTRNEMTARKSTQKHEIRHRRHTPYDTRPTNQRDRSIGERLNRFKKAREYERAPKEMTRET